MNPVATRSLPAQRAPLSALSALHIGSLLTLATALTYLQIMIIGRVEMPLPVISGLLVLVAGLAAAGRRWAPIPGALLAAMTVLGNIQVIIYDLTHPEAFHTFTFASVTVGIVLVAVASGVAAVVQSYRSTERALPRGTVTLLAALAAMLVGAVLVASIPREASAGVSPEILAQLPAITTPGMEFGPQELRVQAGEQVAFRLDNPHAAPHSFDVDELNVHVPVSSGAQALVLFTPAEPGTYTFYCGVPGHREAGMVGTLVVE